MKPSAEILLEIPFHDVDMMGVVWHGHYYKYFELARMALFRKFHCDAEELKAMGLALPVIESHCRYHAPLSYGMRIRVKATLAEAQLRLCINYLITEEQSARRLAKGHTIQVAVRWPDKSMLFPVPAQIINLIQKTTDAPFA